MRQIPVLRSLLYPLLQYAKHPHFVSAAQLEGALLYKLLISADRWSLGIGLRSLPDPSDDGDNMQLQCEVSINLHRNPAPACPVRVSVYVSENELGAGTRIGSV